MLGQGWDGVAAVAAGPALGELLGKEVSESTARGTVTGVGGGCFVGMSVGSVGWEIAEKRTQKHWVPRCFQNKGFFPCSVLPLGSGYEQDGTGREEVVWGNTCQAWR